MTLPDADTTGARRTAPAHPAAARRTSTRAGGLVLATVLLLAALVASLVVGSRGVPPAAVLEALLHGPASPTDTDAVIVLDQRLPRTLLGLAVGTALGAAGALMQALTRNPLADPGVLGINWGASAAIVGGIVLFGITTLDGYVWFSLAGAAAVAVLVYLLGATGRSGATPVRLALAGTAVGASLQGVIYAIYAVALVDPTTFDQFRVWRVGSLTGRDPGALLQVLPFLAVGALLALGLSRALNALALGRRPPAPSAFPSPASGR